MCRRIFCKTRLCLWDQICKASRMANSSAKRSRVCKLWVLQWEPYWDHQFISRITRSRVIQYLSYAGGTSGSASAEWDALAGLILRWAQSSGPKERLPPPRLFTNQSLTSSEVEQTPAATPGGSVDSASAAAWERLIHSEQHRLVMGVNRL